mgnify:CR=1 FL=1
MAWRGGRVGRKGSVGSNREGGCFHHFQSGNDSERWKERGIEAWESVPSALWRCRTAGAQ